ncbi:MAG: phosphoribosylformylglycinamidine synthase, partial [Fusobacteria bacterium]
MNHRIYVEKKDNFAVEAKKLKSELEESLNLKKLEKVRVINIYDIFNLEEGEIEKIKEVVLSEVVVDKTYDDLDLEEKKYIAVEYLPGQFDQRADSAVQCINLISSNTKDLSVKTGKVIIFSGDISENDIERIKKYYINEVEMREKDLSIMLEDDVIPPKDVVIHNGFIYYTEEELENFRKTNGLAMTFGDIKHIQNYFKTEEKRNPSDTEIKVLDTYWSDHCRHTTFETILENITLPKGRFEETLQSAFDEYLESRRNAHGERITKKPITLMDMATISAREMRKKGVIDDVEVSEEINACSVFIDVDVTKNGETEIEKYLLMFKNETHNHPTEIEPFGGASTCIGGAIRDPLSGRAYVYQAIRVTGAANPLEKLEDTLPGKLPQKKITLGAAHGYSSYGNQIGVATSHVTEIYHEGYKAKRMEVGAVVAATPASNVRRETPVAGDKIILLGGKTGRDGCGGATGSSKEHDVNSITTCSAEVQKGNAPEERKIQKLFRNPEVTKLIKKCNDFGAGGVSVAIGELADGLIIDLDKVPVKYKGLDGTELAISESQERMAVVVEDKDVEAFLKLAEKENLEAVEVAIVTEEKRLVMNWRENAIVNLSRDFLDTNGVTGYMNVEIGAPKSEKTPLENVEVSGETLKEKVINKISSLNVASQKGLMEMFDSTIGAGTVLMPFGGKYQLTPTEGSIHKIPLLEGTTDTASAITWGYNPTITEWSPYHGGAYAVIESLAKIVAMGGDYKSVRLSFQEYFERLGDNPTKWGKPFAALLGTQYVMKDFDIPAIGGKDSMSGSFNDIDVPPTIISFAVTKVLASNIISPEFKGNGNNIYLIKHNMTKDLMPNLDELKSNFEFIMKNIEDKKIISAMTVKGGGIVEALAKMSFGNMIGAKVNLDEEELFKLAYGSFIVETPEILENENAILLGKTSENRELIINDEVIKLEELLNNWKKTLNEIFPEIAENSSEGPHLASPTLGEEVANKKEVKPRVKIEHPRVFIPAFPGTNCEYDSMRAFAKEGAIPFTMTFRNLTTKQIEESIDEMAKNIDN